MPAGASPGAKESDKTPAAFSRGAFTAQFPSQLSPDPHHPSVESPGTKAGLVRVKITVGFHCSQFPPVCSPAVLAVLQGPSLVQTTRASDQT